MMHFFDTNSHWLDPKTQVHSVWCDSLLFSPGGTRISFQVLTFLTPLFSNCLIFLSLFLKQFNMDYVNSTFSNFSVCFIESVSLLTLPLQLLFYFCLSFSDIIYVILEHVSPQSLSQESRTQNEKVHQSTSSKILEINQKLASFHKNLFFEL